MLALRLYTVVLLVSYKVNNRCLARLGGTDISRVDIKQDYVILGVIYRLGMLYIG